MGKKVMRWLTEAEGHDYVNNIACPSSFTMQIFIVLEKN